MIRGIPLGRRMVTLVGATAAAGDHPTARQEVQEAVADQGEVSQEAASLTPIRLPPRRTTGMSIQVGRPGPGSMLSRDVRCFPQLVLGLTPQREAQSFRVLGTFG